MKLRFRNNSVRLRLNRQEVADLASGSALAEQVYFPGGGNISYILEPSPLSSPGASFCDGVIRISAPQTEVGEWAAGADSIGIYFDLPARGVSLHVAIEKDLECVEETEEQDPLAFPRPIGKNC